MDDRQSAGEPCDTWDMQVLGGWSLHNAHGRVQTTQRVSRLLCYLALNGASSRARIARSLWPGSTEPRAGASLRSTVVDVQSTAPGAVEIAPTSLRLHEEVRVDLEALRTAIDADVWDDSHAAASVLLRSGDLLPDFYDDWVLTERNGLDIDRLRALELLGRQLLQEGELSVAAAVAQAAIAMEPMRESSHRLLVEAHLRMGNRAHAFALYRAFRARSIAEFGIAPSDKFQALVESLRSERRLRMQPPAATGR